MILVTLQRTMPKAGEILWVGINILAAFFSFNKGVQLNLQLGYLKC